MAILEDIRNTFNGTIAVGSNSNVVTEDYPEGFRITQVINGKERNTLSLVGSFMIHQPFEWGETQNLKKEYYSGSEDPTVQVLGPRFDDISISGRLYLKKLAETSIITRETADDFRQSLRTYLRQGALLKFQLGEWIRYGFLSQCVFTEKRINDIEYKLTLSIVSEKLPKQIRASGISDSDLVKPNQKLKDAMAALQANSDLAPTNMPFTLVDKINAFTNEMAERIGIVTGFVDNVLTNTETLLASVNRALGLIRFSRAYLSRVTREVGSFSLDIATLGAQVGEDADKAATTINSVSYIMSFQNYLDATKRQMAGLEYQVKLLNFTVPLGRHLVNEGDTLQTLSVKYYGTIENWEDIYEHNNLRSTVLTVGAVLEIPKV